MAAGRLNRLIEVAEDRLGIGIVPAERLQLLEARSQQLVQFAEEVSELGYHQLGYFSGRPQELNPENRKNLAQKSRMALMVDPLAGAEADLRTNFALGRGVGKPQAVDPGVQKILDEAHSDPVNQEKLYSYEAQRHRSFQLLSDANLLLTAYTKGGRVRFGFQDVDTFTHIVCDPEDEERPLYYLGARRVQVWDVETDQMRTIDQMDEDGRPRLVYWPHWRNVDDYRKEVEEARTLGEDVQVIDDPASHGKLGPGSIYHVRINRIGRTQWGTPPFARTLRFYSSMNQLTEAQVQMQMAAASIVAKNVVQGTPEQVARSASSILNQSGELAAARFGAGDPPADIRDRLGGPNAAGLWYENESSRLEAVNLTSRAADAAQTAQVVRAPISAASQFGQHYLGDAGNANLATATTLELPTLMAVGAWQETLETMQRWTYDYAISQAIRNGRLGGRTAAMPDEDAETPSSGKPLTELWLMESWDQEEMERRTGLDLSYTLEMPYPGRRNLPEVAAMVTTVATTYDAEGFNVPLRRALLLELATHALHVADPQSWVDEVMPEDAADQKILDAIFQRQLDAHSADVGATPEGGTPPKAPQPTIALKPRGKAGVDGGPGDRPKGARTGVPSTREADAYLLELAEQAGMEWDSEVGVLLGASSNGAGA